MGVHLVGAGPGPAALVTVRGAEVLAAADVVVADPAVGPGVVALAAERAERIVAAGPEPALLVARGRGASVVRLVPGDPFLSAAAVEEAAAVLAAGVALEVVPGVPPVTAAPALAGLALARGGEASVGDVRLVAGGGAAAGSPARDAGGVTVAGPAASAPLDWRAGLPLGGLRVVVPRPRGQAAELSGRLRDLGAEPVEVPAVEIVDPPDGGAALRRAAAVAASYDWVVVTSANGADRLLDALGDARRLGPAKVAAIGPGTAAALARRSVVADLVPDRFVAESLLEALPDPPAAGGRLLLARAAVARDVLPDGLAARGWSVDVVAAYRTVAASPSPAQVAAARVADAICFTSSSTVTRWLEAVGRDAVPPAVACIGPVTAATAREHGLTVAVEADPHTVAGLVAGLVAAVAAGTVSRCDPPTSGG